MTEFDRAASKSKRGDPAGSPLLSLYSKPTGSRAVSILNFKSHQKTGDLLSIPGRKVGEINPKADPEFMVADDARRIQLVPVGQANMYSDLRASRGGNETLDEKTGSHSGRPRGNRAPVHRPHTGRARNSLSSPPRTYMHQPLSYRSPFLPHCKILLAVHYTF